MPNHQLEKIIENQQEAEAVKPGKQENELNFESAAVKIQKCFRKFRKRKILVAQNANWFTGSAGNIMFTMLPHTNQTLMPTGQLLFSGRAPICGELHTGIKLSGRNMDHLSGSRVNQGGFNTTCSYARKLFIDLDTLQKQVCFSLGKNIDYFSKRIAKNINTLIPQEIDNLIIFLLRITQLKQINFELYNEKYAKTCSDLCVAIATTESLWSEAMGDYYANYSPLNERIPIKGAEERDHYGFPVYEKFSERMTSLREAIKKLDAKICFSPEEILELKQQNFPLIFVSTSIDYASVQAGGVPNELAYKGQLALGEGIQLLVSKEEHLNKVRKYLRQHKLRGKVYVMSDTQFCRINFSNENDNSTKMEDCETTQHDSQSKRKFKPEKDISDEYPQDADKSPDDKSKHLKRNS